MRILLKEGFPDMRPAKALVTAMKRNRVKWKSSGFLVCSVDLGLTLGCKLFNTFDSDDVSGRKQKSIHPDTEASRDVFSSDTGQGRQSGLKPD